MADLRVDHTLGREVSVFYDDARLLTLDYSSAPKPFIHPLCTLSGHALTNFQPSDHYWHRGLWFAIKYVNGDNFWEEEPVPPQNTQRTLVPPTVRPLGSDALRIEMDLDWLRRDEDCVMSEYRTLTLRRLADGVYQLDHSTLLTPHRNVVLDRTPFTTWGGYGGLCLRGTRNWTESKIHLSDGTVTDRPTGIPADWAMLTGKLDGDKSLFATVAMLDHPQNRRHPTPWYGASGSGLYLTPAPLFHEPLDLEVEEKLSLNYRLLIAERALEPAEVAAAYAEYGR